MQYFCDLKPGAGLDTGDDVMDRYHLHRWQALLTGDFHPPFGAWFNPARFTTDHSDEGLAAVKAAVEMRIRKIADQIEDQIGNGEHIVLGRRTLLDASAYAMLRWLRFFEKELATWPNIARLLDAMEQDPRVQQALLRERPAS